jgi:hypothetical protein
MIKLRKLIDTANYSRGVRKHRAHTAAAAGRRAEVLTNRLIARIAHSSSINCISECVLENRSSRFQKRTQLGNTIQFDMQESSVIY